MCRFSRPLYGKPQRDASQDMRNVRVAYDNGLLQLSFEREMNTGDNNDWTFSDSQCYYFIFPVDGGPHSDTNFDKHVNTPTVSQKKMCIGKRPIFYLFIYLRMVLIKMF